MKIKYTIKTLTSKLMLMMLASGLVLVANLDSKAQESSDTLEVDWWDGETVTVNALRDAIANDTDRPDGRVYKLQQGGYYWNTDRIENDGFHLRIVGEKAGVGAQENPPVIQMVETEDGEIDQRMITGLDDVTLKNLWITGSDDTGAETAYQPIQIDAANSNFVFENNIIENSNYAVIAFTAGGNSIHFRDNIYRNLVGTDQQWEGRAISIWADQEEVIIENNTFFNIGMTILQIEGGSSKYVRFNHNTIVGVGRSINTGNWWQEAYFTNNIIVNGFWHGEGVEDYTTEPPREDDYAGMFSIGDLPSQYGTDHGRKIVFSNTSTWRDPAFEAGYEEDTRPQPLFNETIKTEWFGQFDGMMFDNIYEDVNPEFTVYPDVVDDQLQNILDLRNNVVPGNEYYWDPGRSDQTTAVNWPLPEDFSYSNAELMDAGTDGLPLGDLRWFPEQKEDFLANRDQYVDEIESMVETIEIDFAGSVEVEDGQLEGDSEIIGYDYPLQMKLGEGPNITWTYNAPSDGTYTLTLHYMIDSDDGEKGQKLLINDNYVPETEEDHMFAGENGVWEEYDVDVELVEGENKIRIQKSWGWMVFGDVDVTSGGETETLTAIDAELEGDVSYQQVNEDDPAPPSGWFSVDMLETGSSATIEYDAESAGLYSLRFYQSLAEGSYETVDVTINGEEHEIGFGSTGSGWNTADRYNVELQEGTNEISIVATNGNIRMDKVDFFMLSGTVSNEKEVLRPSGFELSQNYPNPFNPTTQINFTLPQSANVKLTVFDVLGRQVAVLGDGHYSSGTHAVTFDATNLSSGMYLYRIETADFQAVEKMMLIK